MSELNWRSPADFYKRIEEAEITGIAWECLRRNPDFKRDLPTPGTNVTAEFRQRWGLCFRS
jgi:Proteobacterial transcriptional regulator-like domain